MKICRQILYSGRVQGVGFRYSVKRLATGYDLTGWVRNLADGTVEVQVAGEEAEIDAFAASISTSHLGGYIRDTRQHDLDVAQSAEAGFEIRA